MVDTDHTLFICGTVTVVTLIVSLAHCGVEYINSPDKRSKSEICVESANEFYATKCFDSCYDKELKEKISLLSAELYDRCMSESLTNYVEVEEVK